MKTGDHYTDKEIIERILLGEKALFELLIRRNNAALYKAGRSYGFTHDDTQDLMQESFIDSYLSLSKFEGRSSFKTWLIRIMLNRCYKKKSLSSFKRESSAELSERSIPLFTNQMKTDTSAIVASRELKSILEVALMQVPEDYRLVFSLRELTGLSTKETAEALSISESNVKVRLNRAKTMLRQEVEKSYKPEDLFEFNLVYCDKMVQQVMAEINLLE